MLLHLGQFSECPLICKLITKNVSMIQWCSVHLKRRRPGLNFSFPGQGIPETLVATLFGVIGPLLGLVGPVSVCWVR